MSGEDLPSRLSRAHGSEPPPGSTTPGRWVDADHLRVGDILLSLDGGQQRVEAISLDETTIDVYNLHVDRLETYAVGVSGWLVHNTYAIYDVGLYKNLTGQVAGTNAHHAGQASILAIVVRGFDYRRAAAIILPRAGHLVRNAAGLIISRNTAGITNARQAVARAILELRRVYPDIPNANLRELIKLNKLLYPEMAVRAI